jgi:hypothetical protein
MDGLRPVGGLAHDGDAVGLLDELRDALPGQGLVVDDEGTDGIGHGEEERVGQAVLTQRGRRGTPPPPPARWRPGAWEGGG